MTLSAIWRHPIKSVGREQVARVALNAGQTLPGDRLWAVAHDASKAVDGEWARCANFLRVATTPALMAIEAGWEGDRLRLTHPERPPLTFDPETEGPALIDWLAPLVPEGRAAPVRLVRAPASRGMTDTADPSITLGNLASHRVVEGRLGRPLSIHRWRCNLWIDGLAPWEEFDLIGKRLRLGGAVLEAFDRIERCRSTEANPETGRRDADVLSVLDEVGHRDFSIGLTVVEGGEIALGDRLEW
ncbi:MOSC domain-containing protein [Jannaschia seohaensis]|uniref:MOSC domain-containing protein n=1 Tax=Jannaschia seohaensis TaxID=475081 RepID=A0A2Y9AQL8_9RHOB|nr:MOSC N-terminal beta barrel domain-containing protein [Jannaschia seohaensis]PWJ18236.1 hypothetical protein BCF38_105224 [Jannaschia seohaensis]SSA46761.1 hypothetical protein SAMN05421539_105224 [Jannaschia seohaensis]